MDRQWQFKSLRQGHKKMCCSGILTDIISGEKSFLCSKRYFYYTLEEKKAYQNSLLNLNNCKIVWQLDLQFEQYYQYATKVKYYFNKDLSYKLWSAR